MLGRQKFLSFVCQTLFAQQPPGLLVETGKEKILGQENQDSFSITKYSFGVVMVVADGLGTKKYSGIGSKRICKAVGDAAKIWVEKENAPIEFLIRLVHNLWDISIYPYSKNECATTCLFCIALNSGKIILGQLGDGIIYYCNDESLNILSEKENDFLNIVINLYFL